MTAHMSSSSERPQVRRSRSRSPGLRHRWSDTSKNACVMGYLCRTFREEPLARQCVSLTEPSNRRAKNPYMRVPETPLLALDAGRGSRFGEWQVLVLANGTPLGSYETHETILPSRNRVLLNSLSQRGDQRAMRRTNNEKMRPMSRKTRIRCPLPQFVEWALVGSRSLLLDPLRSSLRAGAIRRECKSLAHSPGPPQSADLTLRRGRTDK